MTMANNIVVYDGVELGNDCEIGPFCEIGVSPKGVREGELKTDGKHEKHNAEFGHMFELVVSMNLDIKYRDLRGSVALCEIVVRCSF